MTPTQRKALGGTLLFVGVGAVAIVLLKKKAPQTYLLHFDSMDEDHVASVLTSLENHGEIREMTWASDDTLYVRWTPYEEEWASMPDREYAGLLMSRDVATA